MDGWHEAHKSVKELCPNPQLPCNLCTRLPQAPALAHPCFSYYVHITVTASMIQAPNPPDGLVIFLSRRCPSVAVAPAKPPGCHGKQTDETMIQDNNDGAGICFNTKTCTFIGLPLATVRMSSGSSMQGTNPDANAVTGPQNN